MPNYKFDKQVAIVTTSIVLHNFMREVIANWNFFHVIEEQIIRQMVTTNQILTMDESEMELFMIKLLENLCLHKQNIC